MSLDGTEEEQITHPQGDGDTHSEGGDEAGRKVHTNDDPDWMREATDRELGKLSPEHRSIVEKSIAGLKKGVLNTYSQKRKQESEQMRTVSERAALADEYDKLARSNPEVHAAMARALGRNDLVGTSTGNGGNDSLDDEIASTPEEKELLRKLDGRYEARMTKALNDQRQTLEAKFNRGMQPLHEQTREVLWEKEVAAYPDDEFPEVHAQRDEILEYAARHGVPMKQALHAIAGPDIQNRLQSRAAQTRKERVVHSEDVSESPYSRIRKTFKSLPKGTIKSSEDADKWFRSNGGHEAFMKPRKVGAEA